MVQCFSINYKIELQKILPNDINMMSNIKSFILIRKIYLDKTTILKYGRNKMNMTSSRCALCLNALLNCICFFSQKLLFQTEAILIRGVLSKMVIKITLINSCQFKNHDIMNKRSSWYKNCYAFFPFNRGQFFQVICSS